MKHPFMAIRLHRSSPPVGPLSDDGYSGIIKKVAEVTEAAGEEENEEEEEEEEEEELEGGGREGEYF